MQDCEILQFEHVIIDSESPENPHIKAVGDINGDGIAEVIVASSNGGALVWYERPDWKRHVIAPEGKWSCYAQIADMDNDGFQDILISDWYGNNRMEWYENPMPEGSPAAPWRLHVIGIPRAHDIALGDLDGDGKMEIVTRAQGKEGDKIVIWKRSLSGLWGRRVLECPMGEGLALGDIDGDGKPEVITSRHWYDPPTDVLRDEWREYVFAHWHEDAVVKAADMNGNGRLDVILTRSEGPHRMSWFESPPEPREGIWLEHVIETSIDFAHSLVVCDMDGDGKPDIVTAEMHQSKQKRVMVYFNRGGGLEWERQIVATTGSHNVCVADIDGDGRPDIVGANWSGKYQPVEMWRNLGKQK